MKLVHLSILASLGTAISITPSLLINSAFAAAADPSNHKPTLSQPSAQPVSIDGFRSARFGMDEADVRKAIALDFKLSGGTIHSSYSPLQRTDVFSINVPRLVSGSGTAVIDYVFGYHSKRLIEVNINWSLATDPSNIPSSLLTTGATLQNYFESEGFPTAKTIANSVLSDGSVLLFRAIDAAGHAVILRLAGPLSQSGKDHHTNMMPASLSVAYVADPLNPDVFQLPKGSF